MQLLRTLETPDDRAAAHLTMEDCRRWDISTVKVEDDTIISTVPLPAVTVFNIACAFAANLVLIPLLAYRKTIN